MGKNSPGAVHLFSKRRTWNPIACLLIFLAIALVGGRRAWVVITRPAYQGIVEDLGSLSEIVGRPVPDTSGARVAFSQRTENGVGVFIGDISTRKKYLLADQANETEGAVRPLGWSPDNALFACTARKVDERDGKRKDALAICSATSGQTLATIFWTVDDLAWLTPDSFIIAQNDNRLLKVERLLENRWSRPMPLDKGPKPNATNKLPYSVKNLVATSPNSIAWQSGNKIWQWKLDSEAPSVLWKTSTNTQTLVEFAFCPENGGYLIHLHEAQGDSATRFFPASGQMLDWGKIGSATERPANLIWLNHGKGHAYLLSQSGQFVLYGKMDDSRPAAPLFAGSNVHLVTGGGGGGRVAGSGDHLYIIASLGDEPIGVLEYDATSASVRCVASSREKIFTHAKNAVISNGTVTNQQGRLVSYHAWQPVRSQPGQKHPLLIGQTPYQWSQCAEAAANLGAYYVSIDRPSFTDSQIRFWAEDVLLIYKHLVEDNVVDTGNVYLYGYSAETHYVTQLLAAEPSLWKGAALFSPVSFPDVSKVKAENILLDYGEDDVFMSVDRVKKYQDEAWQNGVSVTVAVETAGHMFTSRSANQGRIQRFAQFLVGTGSLPPK